MRQAAQQLSHLAAPRALLALTLCLGLLTWSVSEQSLANLQTVVTTDPSAFETGTVDIAGLLAGSTASTLPSATAFKWDTSGAGTNCSNVLTQLDMTTQQMAPGHYCVAKVTVSNNNLKSVHAWLRMRLVRRTPAGNAQTDAMNDRLRFYMHEYADGSGRTAAQYQADDCTTASYKPISPVAGTAKSTASIPDVTSATAGNRTALFSVGPGGKNIGTHPGISLPADSDVAALAGSGFGLTAGTGLGSLPTETATLDSSNMSTDPANPATRNAFNLIGNDEVTNPRQTNNSNVVNGTRPGGTLPEADLRATTTRYYCAAIYFPSDTDLFAGNAVGDNAAATGSLVYHLVVTAAQQANRSVGGPTPTPLPTATPTATPTRTPTATATP